MIIVISIIWPVFFFTCGYRRLEEYNPVDFTVVHGVHITVRQDDDEKLKW